METGEPTMFGSNWEVSFRLRLSEHPGNSFAPNRKGLLYDPTSGDGLFLDGDTLGIRDGFGLLLELAHGQDDLTKFHEFTLAKDGQAVRLTVDGAVTDTGVVSADSQLSLRQVGRYDGLSAWAQDWDSLKVRGEGFVRWEFDFSEGAGTTVSAGGESAGEVVGGPARWVECFAR